jgi:hypothetical protein
MLWRYVSWILLPFAYGGALLAPAILTIPFQVFHKHHFPGGIFWVTSAVTGALVVWLFYVSLLGGLRYFRRGIIYLEAIVICAGLLLTVVAVVWLYPPK